MPGDIGRRYGAVSGDRNPIHLHRLTARVFGFPRAIAHGMWTKARCLAALDEQLPGRLTISVSFRRPLVIPAVARFESDFDRDGTAGFLLRGERGGPHLTGTLGSPLTEVAG